MAKKGLRFDKAFEDGAEFTPNAGLSRGTFQSPGSPSPEEEEIPVETVEIIELTRIKPDYNQPRAPLLPPDLHYKFWFENYDCFRVAEEWLDMAKSDPVMESEVVELIEMGGSFNDDGQVNPVTGCWVPAGKDMVFVLETGERRYWAAVLYATINQIPNPVIRASVVKGISRRRHIMENVHQSKPGAVSQAREIAICILEIRNLQPSSADVDPYSFVRLVNKKPIRQDELRQLDETYQIKLTPQRVNQVLKLLEFPTDLLFIADHYRLSSRKLLEIFNYGPDQWADLINAEADSQLALMQKAGMKITAINSQDSDQGPENITEPIITTSPQQPQSGEKNSRIRSFDRRSQPAVKAMIGLRRFQKILLHSSEDDRSRVIDQVANEIALDQDSGPVLLGMLEELVSLVRVRYGGRQR